MRLIDDDTYELSTGRQFYANNGTLGLSPDHSTGGVDYGADGSVCLDDDYSKGHPRAWTPAEKRELGEFMIALWTAWTEKADPR